MEIIFLLTVYGYTHHYSITIIGLDAGGYADNNTDVP